MSGRWRLHRRAGWARGEAAGLFANSGPGLRARPPPSRWRGASSPGALLPDPASRGVMSGAGERGGRGRRRRPGDPGGGRGPGAPPARPRHSGQVGGGVGRSVLGSREARDAPRGWERLLRAGPGTSPAPSAPLSSRPSGRGLGTRCWNPTPSFRALRRPALSSTLWSCP